MVDLKIQSIPLNEKHRFLIWQPSHSECEDWADWFKKKGVEHLVVKSPDKTKNEWAIYKHMTYLTGDRVGGLQVIPCCDAYKEQADKEYKHFIDKYQTKLRRDMETGMGIGGLKRS